MRSGDETSLMLVSVPDPKPTPARIAFSIVHALYWKRYTRQMRSGDETRLMLILSSLVLSVNDTSKRKAHILVLQTT